MELECRVNARSQLRNKPQASLQSYDFCFFQLACVELAHSYTLFFLVFFTCDIGLWTLPIYIEKTLISKNGDSHNDQKLPRLHSTFAYLCSWNFD